MIVDKKYCASSYLMFRRIVDANKGFWQGVTQYQPKMNINREVVCDSKELFKALQVQMDEATLDGKAALALSGGIDSAILAKMMPKGSVAYTFKCIVPGVQVIDETEVAAKYAKECKLDHRIIEICWDDIEKYAPLLMKHKGSPIHSIEIQIYLAALKAKSDGFERLVFGEAADCVFGGLSNILSRTWSFGDFVERYSYVMPYKVLKESELVLEPFVRHQSNGYIDPHEFMSTEFYIESVGSYINACETANCGLVVPYANCILGTPLDYNRIRNGENKYLVREIFRNLYKDFDVPPKQPMPRPTNEWFKNWEGPIRREFYPHCTDNMTGDQKWLVWCLEKFLNLLDENK